LLEIDTLLSWTVTGVYELPADYCNIFVNELNEHLAGKKTQLLPADTEEDKLHTHDLYMQVNIEKVDMDVMKPEDYLHLVAHFTSDAILGAMDAGIVERQKLTGNESVFVVPKIIIEKALETVALDEVPRMTFKFKVPIVFR
jgi:hypothetical protein